MMSNSLLGFMFAMGFNGQDNAVVDVGRFVTLTSRLALTAPCAQNMALLICCIWQLARMVIEH